jgi:hypothetical protein
METERIEVRTTCTHGISFIGMRCDERTRSGSLVIEAYCKECGKSVEVETFGVTLDGVSGNINLLPERDPDHGVV